MNQKAKKILLYSGLTLDVVITVFLFVISIIMIATMPDLQPGMSMEVYYKEHPGFITYLQANPTTYLLTCVVPLILLLVANVILLVLYINRAGKRKMQLSDLNEDQKAALREAILKDIESPKEEEKE